MAQPTPYIGSKISLISKLDIRYEGILYTVDSKESTIALSKVRSFGTEDRNAAHVVPPQDDVYDYIIFKANDIKDLIVCETPKPPAAPGLPYDPAILSVSQKPSAAAAPPAPVGSERRSGSENATRTSTSPTTTTTTNAPSQQQPQPQQSWKNNDNKANNSNYRQGGGHQNRQHGYEGNNKPQQPRNYESQNRNDNYRQGNNQQNNRNYDSQNRNNSYNQNQNNRGGPRNQNSRGNGPRPHGPRNNLKFENDYDFEKAYEQFKETLEAIVGDVQNVKIDDSQENDESSVKSSAGNDETFYDKNKSFFDSISCEALEKEEGKNTRPDWKKERLTNQETFGQQSVRSFGYRRGGFNNRGGGYNNRGGGGYGNRQQGYDNNRRQSGSYDNNRRGGGGGYARGGYDNNRGRGGQQGRDNNSSRQQGENKHN